MTTQDVHKPDADAGTIEPISLGAESPTERAAKRIVPWVVSVGVHLGLIALGFVLTWTVVQLRQREAPVRVEADWNNLQYEPVSLMDRENEQDTQRLASQSADPLPSPQQLIDDLLGDRADPMSDLAPSRLPAADFSPPLPQGAASFLGLSSSNARKIVYVIDASGSMISAFRTVLDELERSLEQLSPPQEFQVVFFQRNQAVAARGKERLVPAIAAEKRATMLWVRDLRNIRPEGPSNPLQAIRTAIAMKPDVVFLLSQNITGLGEFEIDQRDLLDLLEQINPIDPETGRRVTQINCIQFLDPDPLDTLFKIAERHGGPKSYKFLDRGELGIATPQR